MKLRINRRRSGPAAAHGSQYGPGQAPTITAGQRDAIYEQVLDRMSAAGDLPVLIARGDLQGARRLGREVSDDLQLVLDALDWGEGSEGIVELALPPEQLRRTFSRLRERAAELQKANSEELVQPQAPHERTETVIETCDQVLAAVGYLRGEKTG